MKRESQPTISVIIPCHNQGRFLGDAIQSVRAQDYANCEIIVIDDGSTDNTSEVAGSFPGVVSLRQRQKGPAHARNAGFHRSAGTYIVFLDADDRLLPGALATGVSYLTAHPEALFVYGPFAYIDENGKRLPGRPPGRPPGDDYAALLRGRNFIAMMAAVMFRRNALEVAGVFDTAFTQCEDYALYLTCARQGIIGRHDQCVAEYRQHPVSFSRNHRRTLTVGLAVLRAQWPHVRSNESYRQAYSDGLRSWREHFGKRVLHDLKSNKQITESLLDFLTLLRCCPGRLFAAALRRLKLRD